MLETTNIEINTCYVKVSNNDLEIDAYLAQPSQKANFGAVIVFPEIFGINSNIRDITELIAKQGYVAIAPAMYQRIGLLAEVGKRVRGKGKRNKKNLSPLTFPLFPPLAKVTFARGLLLPVLRLILAQKMLATVQKPIGWAWNIINK